ncbi:MAG: hypothetical protein ACO3J2_04145 [Chthoniobacterales bacterium]
MISSVAAGGSSFDIGAFLGAGRYYSNGVTGQGTKTANLEAGHIWNGHETLQHVTNYLASSSTWSNGNTAALYDRHATWVGMVIGGRQTTNGTVKQQGIAYGTDLLSRAIATSWSSPAYALSFGVSTATYRAAFTNSFAQADVINSSYGFSDPSGSNVLTMFSDAIAAANIAKLRARYPDGTPSARPVRATTPSRSAPWAAPTATTAWPVSAAARRRTS